MLDYSLFAGLCHKYGYTFEPFVVKTADDWNLSIFHITGYLGGDPKKQAVRDMLNNQKLPVLAVPGSYNDAESWLRKAQDGKPMPLQLYDHGYDIWLGNSRGTKYSNVSDIYPINDESFDRWNFSWKELGLYDTPSFIDLILK